MISKASEESNALLTRCRGSRFGWVRLTNINRCFGVPYLSVSGMLSCVIDGINARTIGWAQFSKRNAVLCQKRNHHQSPNRIRVAGIKGSIRITHWIQTLAKGRQISDVGIESFAELAGLRLVQILSHWQPFQSCPRNRHRVKPALVRGV